jgi:small-conductance mechanosensitive channel
MVLKETKQEDVKKINDEICQIINERYLLTTFAITTFGIIIAWLIPKAPEGAGANPPIFYYAGSILLIGILSILYLFNYCLKGMVRIFSTYLQVTETSGWEQNWQKYRDVNSKKFMFFKYSNYWGYTKAQTIIFFVLGVFAFIFPISIIYFSKPLTFQFSTEFIIHSFVSGVYLIFIFSTGFLGLFDPENKAMDRWKKIKELPAKEDTDIPKIDK